jgi:hypothetical protein
MANSSELKIYIETYKLLETLTHAVKIMRRDLKFTLGDKLLTECIEAIVEIHKANKTHCISERSNHIANIELRIDTVKLLIRLAHDMKVMSTSKYSEVIPVVEDIVSQCRKWKRFTDKSGT